MRTTIEKNGERYIINRRNSSIVCSIKKLKRIDVSKKEMLFNEQMKKQSKAKKFTLTQKLLHSFHLSKLQQSLQLNFKELFGCGQHFWHSKEGSVEKNRVMIRCTLGLTCIIINGLTDLSSDNPQSQVQWSFLLLLGY